MTDKILKKLVMGKKIDMLDISYLFKNGIYMETKYSKSVIVYPGMKYNNGVEVITIKEKGLIVERSPCGDIYKYIPERDF